jgi:hypothetical protein
MHLPQADGRDNDLERDTRRVVANEIAARLRNRGVHLTGRESDEELVRVLDAVERFEATVARHGGDLMVDEPVNGDRPIQPDDRRFVLPHRHDRETIDAFIDRLAEATERATRR